VGLHRLDAQAELGRHLGVAPADGDELGDPALGRGELAAPGRAPVRTSYGLHGAVGTSIRTVAVEGTTNVPTNTAGSAPSLRTRLTSPGTSTYDCPRV
jgi:hypothetical protein